jgi:hypothetical protein
MWELSSHDPRRFYERREPLPSSLPSPALSRATRRWGRAAGRPTTASRLETRQAQHQRWKGTGRLASRHGPFIGGTCGECEFINSAILVVQGSAALAQYGLGLDNRAFGRRCRYGSGRLVRHAPVEQASLFLCLQLVSNRRERNFAV